MPPLRSRPLWQAAEPVTAMITAYTGRFAPSPSGPLHFGSLVAALGSYLQARACQGRWLVRIEDLDPPRETAGAARHILQQLEHYGLCWDGEVLWQSQRRQAYREILNLLQQRQQSYFCTCARRDIQQKGGYYTGHCRRLQQGPAGAAQRLKVDRPVYQFDDQLRGLITAEPALAEEDFIIHRRDGLFAYNLAVVVDDHHQGVTEVVRGADLITPTVRQITLYQQLGWTPPRWLHLPLVLNGNGNKLSKQNHAPALPPGDPRLTLCQALRFLGQSVPDEVADMTPETLLACAVAHWEIRKIPLSDADGPDVTTTAFSNDSH